MTTAEKYVAPTLVALIGFVCGLHFGFNGYAVIGVFALITGYFIDRLIARVCRYRDGERRYKKTINELEAIVAACNARTCYKHSDMEGPKPGSLFPLSAACCDCKKYSFCSFSLPDDPVCAGFEKGNV